MPMTDEPETIADSYILDDQVGFMLRLANQRHTTIFAAEIGSDLTPTQWATLAKLSEVGPTSQNLLGRLTAMDAATIKGVVDRLLKQGYIETEADPGDARRLLVSLTEAGHQVVAATVPRALQISEATLTPLTRAERGALLKLLRKLD
jgi:DNA-binding MarR family transcriptional regulator